VGEGAAPGPLPWQGGCRCGALRIRITRPPLLTGACHCAGCQKMSASAFSLTLTVPGDALEVIAGEPVIGGLGGPQIHHHHCDICKSWVFTKVDDMDWFVNVRATMLDDHAWFTPYIETYTSEGFAWATTGAVHSFAAVPAVEGWEPLMAEFAAAWPTDGRRVRGRVE
jgi:hypothetical protein